jgi:carbonic anhydrase/acetyltransferase-like protein (isoleucine patch superfamily)
MIGDITVGRYSSFYHGVTLRGDTCRIIIGNKTVIQDNSTIINTELDNHHAEIRLGDKVLIGVNCLIDQCRIDDGAVISNGVTIHRGCHIQAGAMVAAGSILPPKTVVPSGQIFAGNPAKYLRDLRPKEIVALSETLTELRELSNVMVEHTEKTHYEFIEDMLALDISSGFSETDKYKHKMNNYAYWMDNSKNDEFGVEASNAVDGIDEWENEGIYKYTSKLNMQDDMDLHYEQDMTHFPEEFKKYGENYARGDEIRSKFENEIPGESPGWPNQEIPQRPGVMRAWVNKWDPDYNTKYKQVGTQLENRSI